MSKSFSWHKRHWYPSVSSHCFNIRYNKINYKFIIAKKEIKYFKLRGRTLRLLADHKNVAVKTAVLLPLRVNCCFILNEHVVGSLHSTERTLEYDLQSNKVIEMEVMLRKCQIQIVQSFTDLSTTKNPTKEERIQLTFFCSEYILNLFIC